MSLPCRIRDPLRKGRWVPLCPRHLRRLHPGRAFSPLAQVGTAAVGRQLVLAGIGPMVEVAAVVKADAETGALQAVPIGELRVQRFLARARGRAGSDAVSRTAGLMRECVAVMVTDGSWPGAKALDRDGSDNAGLVRHP